ncbi:MAG: cytidine deaminase [Chitinophagaceae bacterium]|nr:cytidine deaminase [Chitinophagaceae bacterium]
MDRQSFKFEYEVYDSSPALNSEDGALFAAAQKATGGAYAPYSGFSVGAAARLANGEIITGGNQENASFPAGLCAEGVVMAASSARFPGVPIEAIAITYRSENTPGDGPISPCGICRQSLQEYKSRSGRSIRLVMGGQTGKIIAVDDAACLLPFAFKF